MRGGGGQAPGRVEPIGALPVRSATGRHEHRTIGFAAITGTLRIPGERDAIIASRKGNQSVIFCYGLEMGTDLGPLECESAAIRVGPLGSGDHGPDR